MSARLGYKLESTTSTPPKVRHTTCPPRPLARSNKSSPPSVYGTEGQTLEALDGAGVSRSSIWITSKIYDTSASTPSKIRASIEGSISKLGSVPDLFLIHNPYLGDEELVVPTWKVMEDMKDEGRLKSIGVSNFRPQDFEKILKEGRHKPAVHQVGTRSR